MDKRRISALGKVAGTNSAPRMPRQVLSSVNAGSNAGDQSYSGSDAGSTAGIEFGSREEVERLLGEKMKGKNKNDFKVMLAGSYFLICQIHFFAGIELFAVLSL